VSGLLVIRNFWQFHTCFGFRSSVREPSVLLGFDAASFYFFPTFRDKAVVSKVVNQTFRTPGHISWELILQVENFFAIQPFEIFRSHLTVDNFCVHNKKTEFLMFLRAAISVCLRKVLRTYCPRTNTGSLLGMWLLRVRFFLGGGREVWVNDKLLLLILKVTAQYTLLL
jgi:hypothetical protein